MKDSFWSLIWSSFLEVQGLFIGVVAIILTLILARFPVKTQIPIDILIIVILILLFCLVTIFNALLKIFKDNKKISSKLELCIQNNQELKKQLSSIFIPRILYTQQNTTATVCLLEKSELFSTDSCLSFYYTDESGFEVMIAVGHVINIQTDGKIQALIDQPVVAYQDILEKLANNDSQVLSKIVVKPTIPKSMI